MISSYLDIDKAKHGEMIKALDDDYSRLNRLIYELEVERDAIEMTLKSRYLKDPENLHFKDYESAMYYFEELVDDIMSDWNSEQKCQCDNYEIADQLQHVCFLAGRGSNITSRIIGDNKQETIYLIPYHRVNKQANKKRKIHYKGKVWCPSTQDGIVVFRKDGKIFISGNSPFTNLSVYDKYFLEKLCGDYTHPETGNNPKMEIVQKIQELFLDIMNEEMTRTPLALS